LKIICLGIGTRIFLQASSILGMDNPAELIRVPDIRHKSLLAEAISLQ